MNIIGKANLSVSNARTPLLSNHLIKIFLGISADFDRCYNVSNFTGKKLHVLIVVFNHSVADDCIGNWVVLNENYCVTFL